MEVKKKYKVDIKDAKDDKQTPAGVKLDPLAVVDENGEISTKKLR